MNPDDPKLATIIEKGEGGDVVIVGCPFDYARKREGKKEGEDDGPCCLRRFFGRVGPIVNPQYGISLEKVKLSDYGNIRIESAENASIPEKCIATIQQEVTRLMKNHKLPFIYGGSKEALYAGELAFHEVYPTSTKHLLITGLPSLKRAYDHDKLSSSCALTLLTQKYPQSAVLFGVREGSLSFEALSSNLFEHYTLEWIRQQPFELGETYTQAGTAFEQILSKTEAKHIHISLTVEAIERFRGCRQVFATGLTVQQIIEIFFLLGKSPKVKLVDISEFNSMREDYESSLLLINLLYYFLLGWTLRHRNY